MIKIHFLNVGHGDCIIIENLETKRNSIIDINFSKDLDKTTEEELKEYKSYNIALTNPIEYLQSNNITNIHRFISTHPHMDHISGIKKLSEKIGFTNIWITNHHWKPDINKLSDNQKMDWNFYQSLKNEESSLIKTVHPIEGSQISYLPEDNLKILAPNKELLTSSNANDLSYVILLEYGKRKIIFGGDAEKKTWEYIYKRYDLSNIDILKASHHGRDSGYYQPIVKKMNSTYTIISVGKKPQTDASNKYNQYSQNVWSTRWKGNIVFKIYRNGKIEYSCEYNR